MPNAMHIRFMTFAKEYSDAASLVYEHAGFSRVSIPMVYLYAHAIELAIKSILAKHGMDNAEIKRTLGHDLEKCLTRAETLPESRHIDDPLRQVVKLLNPYYKGKHLEYHPEIQGGMRLPDKSGMKQAVDRFIGLLDARYWAEFRAAAER